MKGTVPVLEMMIYFIRDLQLKSLSYGNSYSMNLKKK